MKLVDIASLPPSFFKDVSEEVKNRISSSLKNGSKGPESLIGEKPFFFRRVKDLNGETLKVVFFHEVKVDDLHGDLKKTTESIKDRLITLLKQTNRPEAEKYFRSGDKNTFDTPFDFLYLSNLVATKPAKKPRHTEGTNSETPPPLPPRSLKNLFVQYFEKNFSKEDKVELYKLMNKIELDLKDFKSKELLKKHLNKMVKETHSDKVGDGFLSESQVIIKTRKEIMDLLEKYPEIP